MVSCRSSHYRNKAKMRFLTANHTVGLRVQIYNFFRNQQSFFAYLLIIFANNLFYKHIEATILKQNQSNHICYCTIVKPFFAVFVCYPFENIIFGLITEHYLRQLVLVSALRFEWLIT